MKSRFLLMGAAILLISVFTTQAKSDAVIKPVLLKSRQPLIKITYEAATNKTTVQTSEVIVVGQARTIHCWASYFYLGKSSQSPAFVIFHVSTIDEKHQVWIEDHSHLCFTYNHTELHPLHEQEFSTRLAFDGTEIVTETDTCALPVGLFVHMFAAMPVTLSIRGYTANPSNLDGPSILSIKEMYALSALECSAFRALAANIPTPPIGLKPGYRAING